MSKKWLILSLFLLILFPAAIFSETQTPDNTPAEYTESEFAQWLKDLRRAEIIMIGSFPFTIFIFIEIFDIIRYFSNGFDARYRPWPFRGQNSIPFTEEQKIGVIAVSISFSGLVALADFILGQIRKQNDLSE